MEKPCKGWLGVEDKEPRRGKVAKGKWHFERVKVVRLFLRPDRGEFALMCLGYNIKRAKSLLGFEKLMELMAT